MARQILRWIGVLGVALATGCTMTDRSGSATKARQFDFEDTATGQTPAGFAIARTGGDAEGTWIVQNDPTAPSGTKVLVRKSADKTPQRYPVLVYANTKAKDASVSVRFKPVSGEVDQAAGLVVRYKDKDNYYITRANGLENNLRLYKVVQGQRKQLASVEATAVAGQWHTLEFRAKGTHLEATLDGKTVLTAEDATFAEPGLMGLWTKADSVTYFDDLKIVKQD